MLRLGAGAHFRRLPETGHKEALEAKSIFFDVTHMAVCQNLGTLVKPKIAGKWMFIPLKMYL